MKQCNSSLKFWNAGTTNINCSFNMGNIIMDIAKFLHKHNMIDEFDMQWFNKYSNSARAFEKIDEYVLENRQLICDNKLKVGNVGYIFRIACGVSKTALCIESIKDSDVKLVIKYNRHENDNAGCAYKEPRLQKVIEAWEQQVASQMSKYDSLRGNDEIEPHLLGIFKYYKRYNALVEPFVDYIGTLGECAKKTNDDYHRLVRLYDKYNINDLHGANVGVYKNKVVVLDYGL